MKKRLLSSVLVLIFVMLFSFSAYASEGNSDVAVYDMEKGGFQVFTVVDDNGENAIVTIEELVENVRVSDGAYKVTFETSAWRAGFTVKIANNKITSAYSPFYSVESGTISNASLTLNSSVKATYSFKYKRLISWSTGVVAQISNGDLVVSKK